MFMRRWVVAIAALGVQTAIMFAAGTTAIFVLMDPVHGWAAAWDDLRRPLELFSHHEWWLIVGYPIVLLVLTQAMFLLPYFHRPPLRAARGRSMKISIIGLAVVPAVLTLTLIVAILGLVDLLQGEVHPWDDGHPSGIGWWTGLFIAAALPVSWIIWTSLLLLFMRRTRRGQSGAMRRVLGLIVGGTIIEFILILPLDVMVRRQTNCYCDTRAYVAMCFSLWAIFWLAGPGIVLLLTRRYRARLWSKDHCWNCGFAKGPSPGERCPECGHPWQEAKT